MKIFWYFSLLNFDIRFFIISSNKKSETNSAQHYPSPISQIHAQESFFWLRAVTYYSQITQNITYTHICVIFQNHHFFWQQRNVRLIFRPKQEWLNCLYERIIWRKEGVGENGCKKQEWNIRIERRRKNLNKTHPQVLLSTVDCDIIRT